MVLVLPTLADGCATPRARLAPANQQPIGLPIQPLGQAGTGHRFQVRPKPAGLLAPAPTNFLAVARNPVP
jgi:hypothetical protein